MSELMEHVKSEFKSAVEVFTKDVEALSHESLGKNWGESTRCAYDFAYEVAIINRRMACRCREEDPGPMPWKFGEEWLKAPAEYRSKEKVIELLNLTAGEAIEAAGEDPERKVKVSDGIQPVYQLISFSAMHTSYHDAQLNFIQEMTGDMAVHW